MQAYDRHGSYGRYSPVVSRRSPIQSPDERTPLVPPILSEGTKADVASSTDDVTSSSAEIQGKGSPFSGFLLSN